MIAPDCRRCGATREAAELAEGLVGGWAAATCAALGAQCHYEAWSSMGLVRNARGTCHDVGGFCDGDVTMAGIWQRALGSVDVTVALDGASAAWDFGRWVPHVLVINLGTNDFDDGLTALPANLVDTFRAAYLSLVISAAAAYGSSTRFFLLCGPIRFTYCAPVEWVVAQAQAQGLLAQAVRLESPCSCCAHPGAVEYQALAANVTAVLGSALGW